MVLHARSREDESVSLAGPPGLEESVSRLFKLTRCPRRDNVGPEVYFQEFIYHVLLLS